MIGTKKLSTIRQEIETALSSSGEDPIERLDREIASAKRKGDGTEVMEGLKRFLKAPPMRKRRKRRISSAGSTPSGTPKHRSTSRPATLPNSKSR